MAWVRVESSVARNRKFLKAGPAPSWLWVCGLAYCQEGLTDGFIPHEALTHLGVKNAKQLAHHLVAAGLWDEVEGGWHVHDYLEHNRSAATVEAIREARAAGGRLGGRPKKNLHWNHEGSGAETLSETLPETLPLKRGNPSTETATPTAAETATDRKNISAEPQSDSTPVVMEFPVVGNPDRPTWALHQSRIDRLAEAYPNLDVLAQCRKAVVWAIENPAKRKTAKGMPGFLFKWMDNATNRGDSAKPPTSKVPAWVQKARAVNQ